MHDQTRSHEKNVPRAKSTFTNNFTKLAIDYSAYS